MVEGRAGAGRRSGGGGGGVVSLFINAVRFSWLVRISHEKSISYDSVVQLRQSVTTFLFRLEGNRLYYFGSRGGLSTRR